MSAATATAPPQLRPLALGEIIDVSIKLMRRNWRTLALLVFAAEPGAERAFATAATAATTAAPSDREDDPVAAPAGYDLGGLTDADTGAVRAFLDRRERLETGARRDVAKRLAEALRPKVAGPFDDLPPERFLEALDDARRGG